MSTRTTSANYDTQAALEANQPIYLAELVFGATTLRFTTDNADIVFPTAGNTYTAWGYEFSPISTTASNSIDRCRFKFDNTDLTFSTTYLSTYTFQAGTITLKRIFRNVLGSANDAMILFKGKIKAPQFDEHIAEFEAVSALWAMRKTIPARQQINVCPYTFDEAGTCRNTELIFNGDMELDSNWIAVNGATEGQSDEQAHTGTYSWKFAVDAANEGIEHSPDPDFTTVTGAIYAADLWVYPDDGTRCRVTVMRGSDGGVAVHDAAVTGLTENAWNNITFEYTETAGGSNATIIIESDTEDAHTFYVDDVSVQKKLTLEVTGTVDAGTTDTDIIDAARTEADDYWNEGVVEMTSGDTSGEKRMILTFTAATDTAVVKIPLSAAPDPGDTYAMRRGCNKTSRDCNVKHDNWINHGAFPSIPEV